MFRRIQRGMRIINVQMDIRLVGYMRRVRVLRLQLLR